MGKVCFVQLSNPRNAAIRCFVDLTDSVGNPAKRRVEEKNIIDPGWISVIIKVCFFPRAWLLSKKWDSNEEKRKKCFFHEQERIRLNNGDF